jgi:folate-binding protein YgfZ
MNDTTSAPAALCPEEAAVARELGAQVIETPHGAQFTFPDVSPALPRDRSLCMLPDYGLLRVSGPDGVAFLHAQLTNDVQHLAPGLVQWNGYCTPKGRLLATSLNWRDGDAVYLTVTRSAAQVLRKRLSMYVLRAKARVDDASGEQVALGLIGDSGPALAALGIDVPAPMTATHGAGLTAIGLPATATAGGEPLARTMVWVPVARLQAVTDGLRAHWEPVETATWRLTEVRAGIPRIFAATSEKFVPQMVNLELVGGVSFKKGCYPGQEIVARSQYLGKLKRRMFAGRIDLPVSPGTDVVSAADGLPCGMVVMSAPSGSTAAEVLFECQTGTLESGSVRIDGRWVEPLPLPYPIPAG